MPRTISDEVKTLIPKLFFEKNLNLEEISTATNVSYLSVRGYIISELRKKGFSSVFALDRHSHPSHRHSYTPKINKEEFYKITKEKLYKKIKEKLHGTENLILKLFFEKNLNLKEISTATNVSYPNVRSYIISEIKQKGFPSVSDYRFSNLIERTKENSYKRTKEKSYEDEQLIPKLFFNMGLKLKEISIVTNVSYLSVKDYIIFELRKKGFSSLKTYYKSLPKQEISFMGVNLNLAEKKGPVISDSLRKLFEKQGYLSIVAYMTRSVRQNLRKLMKYELSDLIEKRLKELEKKPSWLAREMGVSREVVFHYINREHMPDREHSKKLFSVLGVPYKTLDDFIENINRE